MIFKAKVAGITESGGYGQKVLGQNKSKTEFEKS